MYNIKLYIFILNNIYKYDKNKGFVYYNAE